MFVKQGVDEGHEPFCVDVSVGALFFPSHGVAVLGQGHGTLFGGGVEDEDAGHQRVSTASPSSNERLTIS